MIGMCLYHTEKACRVWLFTPCLMTFPSAGIFCRNMWNLAPHVGNNYTNTINRNINGFVISITLIFSESVLPKIKLYYQRSKHLFIINELRTFARHFKKMKNNE